MNITLTKQYLNVWIPTKPQNVKYNRHRNVKLIQHFKGVYCRPPTIQWYSIQDKIAEKGEGSLYWWGLVVSLPYNSIYYYVIYWLIFQWVITVCSIFLPFSYFMSLCTKCFIYYWAIVEILQLKKYWDCRRFDIFKT